MSTEPYSQDDFEEHQIKLRNPNYGEFYSEPYQDESCQADLNDSYQDESHQDEPHQDESCPNESLSQAEPFEASTNEGSIVWKKHKDKVRELNESNIKGDVNVLEMLNNQACKQLSAVAPSADLIKQHIINNFEGDYEQLQKKLQNVPEHIAITTNIWTTSNYEKSFWLSQYII
ncbi:hypothetical protein C2G38_2167728 [Gigaspora rosea]|uniref:Uncharacterized protein n=1 Tax=Gigaspora rosea TaxID=44941 RepID=A0A397VTR3_9GLOM|nr:hypothetical protein C2G38_2167728 [Gigaspora rosea]